MFMDEGGIELRFDGKRYGYWEAVELRMSVDDLCADAQLAYVAPGVGDGLGLTANSLVDVLIDDTLVATMRSDVRRRKVGAEDHVMRFAGRSLARELVDCQWSKSLSGLTLGEIVKRLCEAFKVPVKIDATTAVVPDFSMQCEPPANALINAVRASGLLLYPMPDGGLVLTKPTEAAPVTTLAYGDNILGYEVIDEDRLRFSEFIVKGYDWGNSASFKGAAKDSGLTFFRPMHILADRSGQGLGGCERRAEMERNRRQARARRIEIEVDGWRYQDAAGVWRPWAVNTRVRVIIPGEDIDGVFLIGDLAFAINDKAGKISRLTVMPREAWLGVDKKSSKRSAGTKGRAR